MKIAESILSALTEPVLLLDASLRAVLANPAFCTTLQVAPDALAGKSLGDLLPSEDCVDPLTDAVSNVLERGEKLDDFELTCDAPSRGRIVLIIAARRIFLSGIEGDMLLVELRNITQQRETERLVLELSDAHARHGVELEGINKELEAFTHSASHDLRTPPRLTNKIAHLLLKEYESQLPRGAIEKIHMILNSTQEMGKLIEDLLRFSQVSREPLKKRKVDMHRLASQAHDELRDERRGRDIEITIESLPPCQADLALIKQVFLNLLANALKFTRQCEHTTIHVGAIPGDTETVYFVRDNGVGLDMIHADEIFLAFHRVYQEHPVEGSGVGLALVKRIIERHNCRIWAEGLPGKGATIFLPSAESRRDKSPADETVIVSLRRGLRTRGAGSQAAQGTTPQSTPRPRHRWGDNPSPGCGARWVPHQPAARPVLSAESVPSRFTPSRDRSPVLAPVSAMAQAGAMPTVCAAAATGRHLQARA